MARAGLAPSGLAYTRCPRAGGFEHPQQSLEIFDRAPDLAVVAPAANCAEFLVSKENLARVVGPPMAMCR